MRKHDASFTSCFNSRTSALPLLANTILVSHFYRHTGPEVVRISRWNQLFLDLFLLKRHTETFFAHEEIEERNKYKWARSIIARSEKDTWHNGKASGEKDGAFYQLFPYDAHPRGLSMGRVSEAVCDSLLGNVAVSSLARRAEKRNERASSHASFASGKFHVSKRTEY